jgi:hypothetical protein
MGFRLITAETISALLCQQQAGVGGAETWQGALILDIHDPSIRMESDERA